MANLTVEQPNIEILKVEINKGLNVDRSKNGKKEDYSISNSSWLGAEYNTYTPVNDQRHFLDHLNSDHKPIVIAVTALVESPMKLSVMN
jgi:hypothetical protein